MTGKVLQERIAAVTDIPFNIIAEKIGVSAQSMYRNENDFVRAINLGLKEIGAELGIERLQFYAARHSRATIARNDLHIGKDTINEALNHVDSTMAVTDTYIRKSFDNLNEANRKVVDYIVGLKLA